MNVKNFILMVFYKSIEMYTKETIWAVTRIYIYKLKPLLHVNFFYCKIITIINFIDKVIIFWKARGVILPTEKHKH